MKGIFDLINDKIEADEEVSVGLAVSDRPWTDEIENSFVWINGERTCERLDGTSALCISRCWAYDSVGKIEESIKKAVAASEIYFGNNLAILIGDAYPAWGEDENEIVIKNARLLLVVGPNS